MKKYLSFSLALLMVLSLAGCSSGNPSASSEPAESSSAEVSPESSSSGETSGEADGALPENPESADNSSVTEGNGQENTSGSAVYFTSDISPEGLMAVYEALEWEPEGKVAVKLSTGEPPASNYLDPDLIRDLVQSVDGTIVECNTAYGGSRTETAMHMQVAEDHGFTAIADVDILDADGSMELPVEGGTRLESNLVGSHFGNYDSYIVLSHFKGHAMDGLRHGCGSAGTLLLWEKAVF